MIDIADGKLASSREYKKEDLYGGEMTIEKE